MLGIAKQLVRVDMKRVNLDSVVVLVLGEDVRRLQRQGEPARAEGDPQLAVRVQRADLAGRESRTAHRPATLAVQPHLVLVDGVRLQALDADERVVVSVDAEGRLGMTEDLDLARLVGLDPDRGVALAHVPQERAEDQLRHEALV